MEEYFSDSVIKRLPTRIQRLDKDHQRVYVYLRLRKGDHDISRMLDIGIEETKEKIRRVREELISSGQIDLIEDPKFLPIFSEKSVEDGLQLKDRELSMDDRLIIKEFLAHLGKVIDGLPRYQSRLLRLRYNQRMSARDIVSLSKRISVPIVPGKDPEETEEQDIFYALNRTLKEILKGLKEMYCEDSNISPTNIKTILEEIEF